MNKPRMPLGRTLAEHQCSPTPHTHVTKTGAVVECYHDCRSTLRKPSFWVLTTLIFPIEHAIWTLTPLKHLAGWAGL